MKTICITGLFDSSIQPVTHIFQQAGVVISSDELGASQVANMSSWHKKVTESQQSEKHVMPGKFWEKLASDIFVQYLDTPVWGWVESRSLSLLDFWLDFDPNIHFVLVAITPQAYLQQCLSQQAGQINVHDSLLVWQQHHQAMLRFYLRHQQRCIMVGLDTLLSRPQQVLEMVQNQWQMADMLSHQVSTAVLVHDPIEVYLADQLLHYGSTDEIESLYQEMQAAAGLFESEAKNFSSSSLELLLAVAQTRFLSQQKMENHLIEFEAEKERLLTETQKLTKDIASIQKAKQDQEQQHSRALKEQQEESELLLLQLHQVQEELEKVFLQQKETQTQLDTEQKGHQQSKQAVASLQAEKERLLTETQKLTKDIASIQKAKQDQEQQHSRALKEQQEESELLLLQLHQVQEELERYFLAHREEQQKVAQQETRWQRMLQRQPDYLDYVDDQLSFSGDSDDRVLHCRYSDLVIAGKLLPSLAFDVVMEGHIAGLRFDAKEKASFARWLGEAEGLEIIPAPHADQQRALQRLNTLLGLATSDWQLIHQIIRLVQQELATNDELDSDRVMQIQQGLTILTQVLAKLPASMRYDDAILEQQTVHPGYENLVISLANLSYQGVVYPSFDFRIACANVSEQQFGSDPKLEFPETDKAMPLKHWFAESSDDWGDKLELRFALPDAMDLQVWNALSDDQAFIRTLTQVLPTMLASFEAQALVNPQRQWQDWQQLIANVQRIMQQQTSLAQESL
jgi:hypothetical protein